MDIRSRFEAARQRQGSRLADTDLACIADMGPVDVRR